VIGNETLHAFLPEMILDLIEVERTKQGLSRKNTRWREDAADHRGAETGFESA
jgi:hypothetical protein